MSGAAGIPAVHGGEEVNQPHGSSQPPAVGNEPVPPQQQHSILVVDDGGRGGLAVHAEHVMVNPGEDPAEATRREVLEETGWRPGPLRPLAAYAPSNGSSDQVFNLFIADGATHVGEPTDPAESERVEWVPVDRVRALIERGEVYDGLSLTALLWALAFGAI